MCNKWLCNKWLEQCNKWLDEVWRGVEPTRTFVRYKISRLMSSSDDALGDRIGMQLKANQNQVHSLQRKASQKAGETA